MHVIRAAEARRERWRNDGGWTSEIVRVPAGSEHFDWRLSVADVETDGPFSTFAGFDRDLVLLNGAGMTLQFGAKREPVLLSVPGARCRFAGEESVHAVLADGATRDLNLMWRRESFDVEVAEWRVGCPQPWNRDTDDGGNRTGIVVAHVAQGPVELADGRQLSAGDTVVAAPGEQCVLSGDDAADAGVFVVVFVVVSVIANRADG